jgi:hypothetical protein
LRAGSAPEKLEGNAGQAELVGDDLVLPNSALRRLLHRSRIKPGVDQWMKSISASSPMNTCASSY